MYVETQKGGDVIPFCWGGGVSTVGNGAGERPLVARHDGGGGDVVARMHWLLRCISTVLPTRAFIVVDVNTEPL
jgi:hypothetical protein